MKKLFYTTTAFVFCGSIMQANAACIATPNCLTMGYTSSTACGGGLKCPFGEYWYCPEAGGSCGFDNLCTEDFKDTCVGRGYVYDGGIGTSCLGKYRKCECYEGFEWQDGQGCVEITDCRIGSILFSDKSCSMSDIDVGTKTPIGVVVYLDGNGHGQALALKSVGNYVWDVKVTSSSGVDISSLPNLSSSAALQDFASCENSEKIMAHGDSSIHPAVWAAHEYSTEGTNAGDWCLPAAGIFSSIYNNQSTINTGFSRAGGTQFTFSPAAWSSSEYDYRYAWYSSSYNGSGLSYTSKYVSYQVRPVLEF